MPLSPSTPHPPPPTPHTWAWSVDHGELCRVVDSRELWGDTHLHIWLPARDATVSSRADLLLALSESPAAHPAWLRYAAAAARIEDTLTGDTLLAPIGGSLIPLPHQIPRAWPCDIRRPRASPARRRGAPARGQHRTGRASQAGVGARASIASSPAPVRHPAPGQDRRVPPAHVAAGPERLRRSELRHPRAGPRLRNPHREAPDHRRGREAALQAETHPAAAGGVDAPPLAPERALRGSDEVRATARGGGHVATGARRTASRRAGSGGGGSSLCGCGGRGTWSLTWSVKHGHWRCQHGQ